MPPLANTCIQSRGLPILASLRLLRGSLPNAVPEPKKNNSATDNHSPPCHQKMVPSSAAATAPDKLSQPLLYASQATAMPNRRPAQKLCMKCIQGMPQCYRNIWRSSSRLLQKQIKKTLPVERRLFTYAVFNSINLKGDIQHHCLIHPLINSLFASPTRQTSSRGHRLRGRSGWH